MIEFHANDREFFNKAIYNLMQNDFSIRLENKDKITLFDTCTCNGYFNHEPKEFCLAVGKPYKEWFYTFVHEYCHFLQWLTKNKAYNKVDEECGDDLDQWLEGKLELTDKAIKRVCKLTRDMEIDCEKKVIANTKVFNLSIDKDLYIKKANAYGLFHNTISETREFYKVAPYEIKEILELMPSEWIPDFDNYEFYSKFEKLYKKYCL